MSNEITSYLKYANLQIAAEAFLGLKNANPGTERSVCGFSRSFDPLFHRALTRLRTPMYGTDARALGYGRVKRRRKCGLGTRGNQQNVTGAQLESVLLSGNDHTSRSTATDAEWFAKAWEVVEQIAVSGLETHCRTGVPILACDGRRRQVSITVKSSACCVPLQRTAGQERSQLSGVRHA